MYHVAYFTDKIDAKVETLINQGAVGLLPSDTIYGLSASALRKEAVEKIHVLKGRDGNKPLIVLISHIEQMLELGINNEHLGLVKKHWPSQLSVVFQSLEIPSWLHLKTNSLAVRMPAHSELRKLIAKTGPIVSTSANLQGHSPAKSVQEARKIFGETLDFYVDVGRLEGSSSTLVKIENGMLKVLRQGAYKIKS
jgi:L-threonylcarbamoyladenylate synthase